MTRLRSDGTTEEVQIDTVQLSAPMKWGIGILGSVIVGLLVAAITTFLQMDKTLALVQLRLERSETGIADHEARLRDVERLFLARPR